MEVDTLLERNSIKSRIDKGSVMFDCSYVFTVWTYSNELALGDTQAYLCSATLATLVCVLKRMACDAEVARTVRLK